MVYIFGTEVAPIYLILTGIVLCIWTVWFIYWKRKKEMEADKMFWNKKKPQVPLAPPGNDPSMMRENIARQQQYAAQHPQQYPQYQQAPQQAPQQPRSNTIFPNIIGSTMYEAKSMSDRMQALKRISDNLSMEQKQIFSATDTMFDNVGQYIAQMQRLEKEMIEHATTFDDQFEKMRFHLDTLIEIDNYYSKNRKRRENLAAEMAAGQQQKNTKKPATDGDAPQRPPIQQ
jgi:hypothetical protein